LESDTVEDRRNGRSAAGITPGHSDKQHGLADRFSVVPSDDVQLLEFDVVFPCPDGHYTIGDYVHASREGRPPGRPRLGISAYFGAFEVGLEAPAEVTLHVRRLSRAQYTGEAPLAISPLAAVASNRVGVVAQGPMEIFAGNKSVGLVGGAAGRTYWCHWYCLTREAGAEEHLLGLYMEPQPDDPEPNNQFKGPMERLAATFATAGTPLLRTDFTDDAAWSTIVAKVAQTAEFGAEYGDYVLAITSYDERFFEGVTGASLAEICATEGVGGGYVLLADARSMAEAAGGREVTIDYVDLSIEDNRDAKLFKSYLGRTFRCATREVASIEANLAIGNMDFSDFANSVDSDGVFRGFEPGE
jgi:hypothetical protein